MTDESWTGLSAKRKQGAVLQLLRGEPIKLGELPACPTLLI